MAASTDYAAILRVWPGVRAQFQQAACIPETELLSFLRRTIPGLSPGEWQAGREALLRNHLLHSTPDGHYSLGPGPRPQVFAPVVEPAWFALWQQVRAGLAFAPRCLWATHWLRAALPDLPAVLVLEVNWSEVAAAVRLVGQLATFRPVRHLDPATWAPVPVAPPLLLVQPWPRRAPGRLVRPVQEVPTARLEKLVVDLPALLPDFPLAPGAWLTRVQYYYHLDTDLVNRYRVYRQQLTALLAGRTARPRG